MIGHQAGAAGIAHQHQQVGLAQRARAARQMQAGHRRLGFPATIGRPPPQRLGCVAGAYQIERIGLGQQFANPDALRPCRPVGPRGRPGQWRPPQARRGVADAGHVQDVAQDREARSGQRLRKRGKWLARQGVFAGQPELLDPRRCRGPGHQHEQPTPIAAGVQHAWRRAALPGQCLPLAAVGGQDPAPLASQRDRTVVDRAQHLHGRARGQRRQRAAFDRGQAFGAQPRNAGAQQQQQAEQGPQEAGRPLGCGQDGGSAHRVSMLSIVNRAATRGMPARMRRGRRSPSFPRGPHASAAATMACARCR